MLRSKRAVDNQITILHGWYREQKQSNLTIAWKLTMYAHAETALQKRCRFGRCDSSCRSAGFHTLTERAVESTKSQAKAHRWCNRGCTAGFLVQRVSAGAVRRCTITPRGAVMIILVIIMIRICNNNNNLYAESGQTLGGSFSAVSKPNFTTKYLCENSRRDLHNTLRCTVL